MSMNCDVIRDLLPLYHDGVCSEESRALVEAHLNACPGCSAILQELRGEIDLPHEEPNDSAVLRKLHKNVKRAWIRGAAAVLALVMLALAGRYGWWYVHDYCYMQQFVRGREPVVNNMDAYGNTVVLYEVDENGEILGAARDQSNVYTWSAGGYDFRVRVPRYPGDMQMLTVNQALKPIPKNIVPGQEVHTWLNFGREEYVYLVGVEVRTRTQIPGEPRLETEVWTEFLMLDGELNLLFPEYMNEQMRTWQAQVFQDYNQEIMDIIQAAQAEWPFLTEV